MNEEWRTIIDYPVYEVSNTGRVRRKGNHKDLKPIVHPTGAVYITLCDPYNGCKGFKIARLVYASFIAPLAEYEGIVHHKDENPTNNNIDNLLFFANRTLHKRQHAKLSWQAVEEIRLLKGKMNQGLLGALYNVAGGTISRVQLGKIWKVANDC